MASIAMVERKTAVGRRGKKWEEGTPETGIRNEERGEKKNGS
jgi:hypothetical protein